MTQLVVSAAVKIRIPAGLRPLGRTDLLIVCEYVAPPILVSLCGLKVPLRHIERQLIEEDRSDVAIEIEVPKEVLTIIDVAELGRYTHGHMEDLLRDLGYDFTVVFTELQGRPMIDVETTACVQTSDVSEGIRFAKSWQRLARTQSDQRT